MFPLENEIPRLPNTPKQRQLFGAEAPLVLPYAWIWGSWSEAEPGAGGSAGTGQERGLETDCGSGLAARAVLRRHLQGAAPADGTVLPGCRESGRSWELGSCRDVELRFEVSVWRFVFLL